MFFLAATSASYWPFVVLAVSVAFIIFGISVLRLHAFLALVLAGMLADTLGFDVPTIILSGDITSATLKTLAASDYIHVVKPVNPDLLATMISDILRVAVVVKAKAARRADPSKLTVHVIDDDRMIRDTIRPRPAIENAYLHGGRV